MRLAIQRLTGAGWVGVDLFFVLSGFLITSILYEAKQSDGYFKNFYMRRVLRIFPLYYGVLFVAFAVVPLFHPYQTGFYKTISHNQIFLWTYLQNYVQLPWEGWAGFTHFWSLAVEEQFYLVWPAVVFLLNRRALMGVSIGMVVTALAAADVRRARSPERVRLDAVPDGRAGDRGVSRAGFTRQTGHRLAGPTGSGRWALSRRSCSCWLRHGITARSGTAIGASRRSATRCWPCCSARRW